MQFNYNYLDKKFIFAVNFACFNYLKKILAGLSQQGF